MVFVQKNEVRLKPQAHHLNKVRITRLPWATGKTADARSTNGKKISIKQIKINALYSKYTLAKTFLIY
jgi:hypothetical protein